MTPDLINGLFEFAAAIFILHNCRVLYGHKQMRGMSTWSTVFFTAWGGWNIYFYPHLDQMWSFYGGVCVVTVNLLWIAMQLYYRRA